MLHRRRGRGLGRFAAWTEEDRIGLLVLHVLVHEDANARHADASVGVLADGGGAVVGLVELLPTALYSGRGGGSSNPDTAI
jgi:hypothetical protein